MDARDGFIFASNLSLNDGLGYGYKKLSDQQSPFLDMSSYFPVLTSVQFIYYYYTPPSKGIRIPFRPSEQDRAQR